MAQTSATGCLSRVVYGNFWRRRRSPTRKAILRVLGTWSYLNYQGRWWTCGHDPVVRTTGCRGSRRDPNRAQAPEPRHRQSNLEGHYRSSSEATEESDTFRRLEERSSL